MRNIFALAALAVTALTAAPAAAQTDWTANTTTQEVAATVPVIREFKGVSNMQYAVVVQGKNQMIAYDNANALIKEFRYNAGTLLTVSGPTTLSDGTQTISSTWSCGTEAGTTLTAFACATGYTLFQPSGTTTIRVRVGSALTVPAELKPGTFKGNVVFNAAPAGA